jgi:UTP--glucose-1-phosphate uridylyltransferase
MLERKVRKAVIPAAGLGTRFLPVTKSVPKELCPILNKPLIQYAVEEAVAAGIKSIVLVLSDAKTAVREYFETSPATEDLLRSRGRHKEADCFHWIGRMARITSVIQPQPLGLGHAVACAQPMVGDEAFAVLLPDAMIVSDRPAIGQVMDCYDHEQGCVIGVSEIDVARSERYGMIGGDIVTVLGRAPFIRVRRLVEKPKPELAPSGFGIIGRYVLSPDIFPYLAQTPPDGRGEVQLTAALSAYAREGNVSAVRIDGLEFDAGDRLGFAKATVEYARRDPDIGPLFREYLASLSN